jgi:hypothetical protein
MATAAAAAAVYLPEVDSRFADADEEEEEEATVRPVEVAESKDQEEVEEEEDEEEWSDSDVADALDWLDAAEGPDGSGRPAAAFTAAGGAAAARRPNAHGGVLSRPFQPISNRTQKLASHIRATPLEVCSFQLLSLSPRSSRCLVLCVGCTLQFFTGPAYVMIPCLRNFTLQAISVCNYVINFGVYCFVLEFRQSIHPRTPYCST